MGWRAIHAASNAPSTQGLQHYYPTSTVRGIMTAGMLRFSMDSVPRGFAAGRSATIRLAPLRCKLNAAIRGNTPSYSRLDKRSLNLGRELIDLSKHTLTHGKDAHAHFNRNPQPASQHGQTVGVYFRGPTEPNFEHTTRDESKGVGRQGCEAADGS